MRVLIAYDGAAGSEAIFADLPRASLPATTEAVVISVANVVLPPTPEPSDGGPALPPAPPGVRAARAQAEKELAHATALAATGRDLLGALFPTWRIEAEAVADSPAWAIIKKADAWPADLVVVGAHNRLAHRFMALGSVAQQILFETRCAVRIARVSPWHTAGPIQLILGLDGSPGSRGALHAIAARSWPAGTAVRIVSVVDPSMSVADVSITQLTETAADELHGLGLKVSTLATEGDPKEVLVAEAEDVRADAIFVGASGLTRLGHMFLGTVSSAIAGRAPCAVEVVRPLSESQ